MKQIIYITDPRILAIPIIECHEPLLDIKHDHRLQYGEAPECEISREDYTKMRKTVFEKLCQAQQDLPKGWRFKLYEGYRSLTVQQLLFEQQLHRIKTCNPDESYANQFYEVAQIVSPVIHLDGSPNIPPHSTGAAVDIEIIDETGQLINMGMSIKDWSQVAPALFATDCELIDVEARKNRQLLLTIMQSHGFVNYPPEWWHYSYGDRYWAYHQGKKQAIYGSVD
jgi:D-alanyl-D-alanine dipeptidase